MTEQENTVCGPVGESLASLVSFPPRYQNKCLIGQGGMGVVFRASDLTLKRDVAIKVLSSVSEPEIQERFLKEAKSLAKLSHGNIVQLLSSGTLESGGIYLVMEYIEGRSLASELDEKKRLDSRTFYQIFRQVMDGLAHLHEKQIVHRDLKPGNIMLSKDTEGGISAKIIDLGLARITSGLDSRTLTETNAVLGSPYYMSPEQCRGQKAEFTSDIYSLACVMYECLSGKPPFAGDTAFDTMQKHGTEKAPALYFQKENKATIALSVLIETCLQKDPALRPQKVEELKNALDKAFFDPELEFVCVDKKEQCQFRGSKPLILLSICLLAILIPVAILSSRHTVTVKEKASPYAYISNSELSDPKTASSKCLFRLRTIYQEAREMNKKLLDANGKTSQLVKDKRLKAILAESKERSTCTVFDQRARFYAYQVVSYIFSITDAALKDRLANEEACLKLCQKKKADNKDPWEKLQCKVNLAEIYEGHDDYEKARENAEEALKLIRVSKSSENEFNILTEELRNELDHDSHEEGRASVVLGNIYARKGQEKKANDYYQRALQKNLQANEWQGAFQTVRNRMDFYTDKLKKSKDLTAAYLVDFEKKLAEVDPGEYGEEFRRADQFIQTFSDLAAWADKNNCPDLKKKSVKDAEKARRILNGE